MLKMADLRMHYAIENITDSAFKYTALNDRKGENYETSIQDGNKSEFGS